MKTRVVMADVARRAGVHVTTVSLALRDHQSIPAPTRDRLKMLAAQMGYRPDPVLSSLMARRRHAEGRVAVQTLAYVTHRDYRWGWRQTRAHARFIEGAMAKASQLGYKLEPLWLEEPERAHPCLSDILSARGIRGVIVESRLSESELALEFDWTRIGGVRIDYYPHATALHAVANDYRTIVQLAMRRVVEAGYRRIGFVIPRGWDDYGGRASSAGFLAEQQILTEADRIPILVFSEATDGADRGATALAATVPSLEFKRWFDCHRPEVLISTEHFVRPWLQELGVEVPRDVAFVDIFLDPDGTVAGVRQNCERVGGTRGRDPGGAPAAEHAWRAVDCDRDAGSRNMV